MVALEAGMEMQELFLVPPEGCTVNSLPSKNHHIDVGMSGSTKS